MKQNMSMGDRINRAVIGVAALVIAIFFVGGVWDIVLYVIAAVMLLTAAVGICPLYTLFGIATKKA